ncbi:MAG: hypothetical protein N2C12_13880, partial [Planctomycetales bacterium]
MRIFLYEFVSGGGFLGQAAEKIPPSLSREGRAMISALATDFAEIGTVDILADSRLALPIAHANVHPISNTLEEKVVFSELAAAADFSLVIAPEFDLHLLSRAKWVAEMGGRLLGPDQSAISLTSDKQRTIEHLNAAG